MLSRIKLYLKVCNKGEIAKRVEYIIKDLLGYFHVRNKLTRVKELYEVKMPVLQIENDSYKSPDEYNVFNKVINYLDIKKELTYTKEFWRKCDISKYEDVKNVWEINRLQFLAPMALKYNINKDEKYKRLIVDILDYWFDKNKFEYSINWNNNLEVAVRSISIAMALILLKDDELNKKYSKFMYLHASHLYNEISYSEACIPNNHLIGEAVALLSLSRLLNVSQSKKWASKAEKILEKSENIINEDGVSKENSFSYQFFVTKMFILALSFIENKELFKIINKKVISSLNFLKYTIINEEKVINYGDNDDAFFFSIEDKYNLSKDIVRYYNYFFNKQVDKETQIIDKLLAYYSKTIEFGQASEEYYFHNRNLFIYRWDNNVLFFNAKKIEGHAHNDSLAIVLVIDGEEVLLDAGTYSYNLDKDKRKYYRSRNAHNTIIFEKENVKQVGAFRWKNLNESYLTALNNDDTNVEIEGIIEGICKRRLVFNKKNREINIYDSSLCEKEFISVNWIVKNSHLKNGKIYTDRIIIGVDDCNFYKKRVSISEKYMVEKEANAFVTESKETINTKIELI